MPRVLAREGRVLARNGRLVAGTAECTAACCGVDGFYRAFPCNSAIGCGGGDPPGEPIYVPVNWRCASGGPPPTSVIGFDRACWYVDGSRVYQLCVPGVPPATQWCIPDGAHVISPDTALACLPNCQQPECLSSLPRWVSLQPCGNFYPPGTPLPIMRAEGLVGCKVVSDVPGECYIADCSTVFQGREEDLAPLYPILRGVYRYDSCCECMCNPGPASLGCDEQYPPPAQQPRNCCCPPNNAVGATLTYRLTRVTEGYSNCYRIRETEIQTGTFTATEDSYVGQAVRTYRIEYGLGPSCPGFPQCPPGVVNCVEEFTETFPAPPLLFQWQWCPAPLAVPRPCPGEPGVTWVGYRDCDRSYSRRIFNNPQAPSGPVFFGLIRRTTEGLVTITGQDYGDCANGCGSGSGVLQGRDRIGLEMLPQQNIRNASRSGCSSCGGRGL